MAHTSDCPEKLSGEHYISEALLASLGNAVEVDGARWVPEGEKRQIGIANLKARILCRRHNQALTDLDTCAGELFSHLGSVYSDLRSRSLSRRLGYRLISGEALELWMLKVACGIYYGGIGTVGRAKVNDSHGIDDSRVAAAMLSLRWDVDCGLYCRAWLGNRVKAVDAVAVAPVTMSTTGRMIGVEIRLRGVEFMLIFDPTDLDPGSMVAAGWTHRPSSLIFTSIRRSHLIELTWPRGTPLRTIQFTQQFRGARER